MFLSHPRLLVTKFSETFHFYRDIMGFLVNWGDDTSGYASFNDGKSKLPMLAIFNRTAMSTVMGTTDLPLETSAQDRVLLIVEVEDVDKTYLDFTKKGVVFTLPPQDMPGWGIRSAYLRDPDGNLIELSSALDHSKWSDELIEANDKFSQE